MYVVFDRFMRTEIISKPNIRTFFPTELIPGFDVSNVISEDRFEFTINFVLFSDSNNIDAYDGPPYMLFETLSVVLYPK
jgi:hypothetical protein